MTLASVLATLPATSATRLQPLLVVIGVLACAVLATAIAVRQSRVLPIAIILLGAEQAGSLAASHDSPDLRTALYAAGLVTVSELACWALEPRRATGREVVARHGFMILVFALGSFAVAGLLLAVTAVTLGRSLALVGVGVAAAVGTLAVIAVLARHGRA